MIGVGIFLPLVALIGYLAVAILILAPIAALHRVRNAEE
jgi:hypothetical protein